ncbi:MAG: SAM-dependent methyltransferase [Candidatus Accumulibacter sp.]|jgi:SAM-dependent MidA family methyltransferase|nr:SAM-dependent methyltransferase [Accumulibacter sp.]
MKPILPSPDADAQRASDAVVSHIGREISDAGGWIGFHRFMEMALHAPGLGYYSGGARKFGEAGDFVTAPELTPIFAQTLAGTAREVMASSAPQVVEVGAGSGRLAADLLLELERSGDLPDSYRILELSGELRERQRATLFEQAPRLLARVGWLDRLPERFSGLVLANELLDALPVHLVRWDGQEPGAIFERGVAWRGGFAWEDRPAQGRVLEHARRIAAEYPLPAGYLSEIGLAAADWTATWGGILARGALLLVDYGFPRHEFYHPQRSSGTLMCHYRHRAHDDPFFLPGLQDITAHVDFTAITEAAHGAGLDLLGYTTQAAFLVNTGVADVLARIPYEDSKRHLPQARAVHKLVSPAEMGELFKVMALGKGIAGTLQGFSAGDRSLSL